jgi:hypothetical protein
MPLFNSQIHWRGIRATVAVVLLTSLALALAIVSYVLNLCPCRNFAPSDQFGLVRLRSLIVRNGARCPVTGVKTDLDGGPVKGL